MLLLDWCLLKQLLKFVDTFDVNSGIDSIFKHSIYDKDIYKIESAHIFVSFSLFSPVIFSKLMVLNQVIQIS